MKKFKFRLESLLKIKKQEQNIKKEGLALQIGKLREIENSIKRLIKEIDSYSSFYEKAAGFNIVLWNYGNYKDYLANLSKQLADAERQRTRQAELVKKLQVEYLRLKRTVDSLEKMKKNDLQLYVTETQKEEYMVMDELALTKHFVQEDNDD